MNRKKLGSCIAAALITLGGASYLATPAAAAGMMADCTAGQRAYAAGYADGFCKGIGGSYGVVTSCASDPTKIDNFEFYFDCY